MRFSRCMLLLLPPCGGAHPVGDMETAIFLPAGDLAWDCSHFLAEAAPAQGAIEQQSGDRQGSAERPERRATAACHLRAGAGE